MNIIDYNWLSTAGNNLKSVNNPAYIVANTNLVSSTGHGLVNGQAVLLTKFTGLSSGFYIISNITDSTFNLNVNQCNQAIVINSGIGYQIGDMITVDNGVFLSPTVLSVTAANGGSITNVNIQSSGQYSAPPNYPVPQYSTNGGGSGATFILGFINSSINGTVTETGSWSSAGAWRLGAAANTYQLAVDVLADFTAFIETASGITLDGADSITGRSHSICYANIPALIVPNGGFETGDFTSWDVSQAPNASVQPSTNFRGFYGKYLCQLTSYSSTQIIESAPIYLPVGYREYTCVICMKSNLTSSAFVEIIDINTGLVLEGFNIFQPLSGYFGYGPFNIANPTTVRIRITVNPPGGKTDTAYIDYVSLRYSRDHGIHAGGSTVSPGTATLTASTDGLTTLVNAPSYNVALNPTGMNGHWVYLSNFNTSPSVNGWWQASGINGNNFIIYGSITGVFSTGKWTDTSDYNDGGGTEVPWQIYTLVSGFPYGTPVRHTVKNLNIYQGLSAGFHTHAFWARSISNNGGYTIDNCTISVGSQIAINNTFGGGGNSGGGGGCDTSAVYSQYGGSLPGSKTFTNNTFYSYVDMMTNRQRHNAIALVYIENSQCDINFSNNTLYGYGGMGISVGTLPETTHVIINNNKMYPSSFVADPYSIALQATHNFVVSGNIINDFSKPYAHRGRGIFIDCWGNGVSCTGIITKNIVINYEQPMIEYGFNGIEATAMRFRSFGNNSFGGFHDITVTDNVFCGYTDSSGTHDCYGIRFTFDNARIPTVSSININNNLIMGISADPSGIYIAHAASFSRCDPNTLTIMDNNFLESNYCSLKFGDSDNFGFMASDLVITNTILSTSKSGYQNFTYKGINVGDPSIGTSGVYLLNTTLVNGATLNANSFETSAFTGILNYDGVAGMNFAGGRDFSVGTLMNITVQDNGTLSPIVNANITISDSSNSIVATATTDINGNANNIQLKRVNYYKQSIAGGSPVMTDLTPFNVTVQAPTYANYNTGFNPVPTAIMNMSIFMGTGSFNPPIITYYYPVFREKNRNILFFNF